MSGTKQSQSLDCVTACNVAVTQPITLFWNDQNLIGAPLFLKICFNNFILGSGFLALILVLNWKSVLAVLGMGEA